MNENGTLRVIGVALKVCAAILGVVFAIEFASVLGEIDDGFMTIVTLITIYVVTILSIYGAGELMRLWADVHESAASSNYYAQRQAQILESLEQRMSQMVESLKTTQEEQQPGQSNE